jgi:hypothetical protein
MKITIIGGGTAGWLSALWITKLLPHHRVTVIDSSKIGIIGVGEGTTGKFLDVLQNVRGDFGINEADFYRETGATQKMGIRFTNWQGCGETWISPIDNTPTVNSQWDWILIDHWRRMGIRGLHTSTLCGTLAEHNLSSITRDLKSTYSQGAVHFDGHLVGKYFRKIAEPLCEAVIDSEITGWELNSEGGVARVKLATEQWVASDYWIDCSGFARVLAPAVNPGWHSYRSNLSCDASLLFQTPHQDLVEPLTHARARTAGWQFSIPTQTRWGNGYVFDSSVITADEALAELQRENPKIEPRRVLKFEPGRLAEPFCKNVAFIGLSSVFLEPLQATSIHGTIAQLNLLQTDFIGTDQLPCSQAETDHSNDLLNRTFDQFADLIQLSYQSGRTDSKFWLKQTHDMKIRDRVQLLKSVAARRWPLPSDFDFQPHGAGYPVFIYPMLAYDWVNMQQVDQYIKQSTAAWSRYHSVRTTLAKQCLPHTELCQAIQSGKLTTKNFNRLNLPEPTRSTVNLHPLLK